MSYETWKALHYPVPAKDPEALARPITHSLSKWEGLRPEVLAEHGLYLNPDFDVVTRTGRVVLTVDGRTCALCEKHVNVTNSCRSCPLYKVRGQASCSMKAEGEQLGPWWHYMRVGDPEPMIGWLKKALTKETS